MERRAQKPQKAPAGYRRSVVDDEERGHRLLPLQYGKARPQILSRPGDHYPGRRRLFEVALWTADDHQLVYTVVA